MKSSQRPNKARRVAAAVVGAAMASWPCALYAQGYQLGPRSLYPVQKAVEPPGGPPLVMRDAIQNIVLGTRLLATRPRIMGGQPAPFGAYPWMASLELRLQRRRDAHFCGGAFIAPHWVITAAHCVKPSSAGAVDVLGGTNTLETGGTLYPVDRIIVHEKYDTDTQDYDVALLHLSKPFPGKTVRLLSAADAARYAGIGAYAICAGWGLTAEGGEVSNVLRQVTVQIVSNQTCNGLAAYAGAVTDGMLCAGFPAGGKDACQGDSGGPLMVADGQGGYFLAGITSWGEGCGRPNKFGVYTRVSTVADWVAGKIGAGAAPAASNPATTSAKAVPTASKPTTKSAKVEPNKAAPAAAGSNRSERFGQAAPMSKPLPRSVPAPSPQSPSPPAEEAAQQQSPPPQATFPLPLPPVRPPALVQQQEATPRLRSKRRFGAPTDRKYSPAYPARAQSRRSSERMAPSTARRNATRGNYYMRDNKGRGYYVVPRNGGREYYVPYERNRAVIQPPFDLHLFR